MKELPEPLSAALRTLAGAIDRLEAAAERRVEADAARSDLDLELTVMADDRARLARELDASQARAATLVSANAEVSRRLDHASASLHAMLATPPAPSPEAED